MTREMQAVAYWRPLHVLHAMEHVHELISYARALERCDLELNEHGKSLISYAHCPLFWSLNSV
jgi:hypothetical protein